MAHIGFGVTKRAKSRLKNMLRWTALKDPRITKQWDFHLSDTRFRRSPEDSRSVWILLPDGHTCLDYRGSGCTGLQNKHVRNAYLSVPLRVLMRRTISIKCSLGYTAECTLSAPCGAPVGAADSPVSHLSPMKPGAHAQTNRLLA